MIPRNNTWNKEESLQPPAGASAGAHQDPEALGEHQCQLSTSCPSTCKGLGSCCSGPETDPAQHGFLTQQKLLGKLPVPSGSLLGKLHVPSGKLPQPANPGRRPGDLSQRLAELARVAGKRGTAGGHSHSHSHSHSHRAAGFSGAGVPAKRQLAGLDFPGKLGSPGASHPGAGGKFRGLWREEGQARRRMGCRAGPLPGGSWDGPPLP